MKLIKFSSKENLLIIGAGQYGMVAKEISDAMNCFGRIDFLDDNKFDCYWKDSSIREILKWI